MTNELFGLDHCLEKYLNNTTVWPDGTVLEIKKLGTRIGKLKLEVRGRELNPPHFHVSTKCGTVDAMFYLNSGEYWKGEVKSDDIKRVRSFFRQNQSLFSDLWKEQN